MGFIYISIITIFCLILSVVFIPEIRIRKIRIETYWVVSLVGAAFLIALKYISINEIFLNLINDNTINPIKILIIFISMTIMSIILDELGFFKKISYLALKKAKGKQINIFFYLYITISVLTIFTSNDIIILTFTPFICYFTKHAKINPIPYLISEFVAANTWSMMFVIGNPTNIYLASAYNISFLSYFQIMFLPTIFSAIIGLGLLFLIFRRDLRKAIEFEDDLEYEFKNKNLVIITLIHLGLCTFFLTIASYIEFEMWYICLSFTLSILIIIILSGIFTKKDKAPVFKSTIQRAPWSLIPFVIAMVIFVQTLSKYNITVYLSEIFSMYNPIYAYGISSYLSANIMNNIPMTVLFSEIIKSIDIIPLVSAANISAIYATVIGSNIGAFLTPIGALAGIMWMRILKREKIELSFFSFIKYGIIISIPTILIALTLLSIVI